MKNVNVNMGLIVLALAMAPASGGCLYTGGSEAPDGGDRGTEQATPIMKRQVFGPRRAMPRLSHSGVGQAIPAAVDPTDDAEYATGVSLYTCDYDPPRLTLPRGKAGTDCEMTAVATPYRDDDADVYDVSVPLDWSTGAGWATIEPFVGNQHRTLVYGRGAIDLFDTGNATEPETTVRVCAQNDCRGGGSDCQDEVCRQFMAYGVVNLEGDWCLGGATFYEPCSEHGFVQDGRHLVVRDSYGYRVGEGGILAATVSWEESDVLYVGTIDPGRDRIEGQAYWEMTDDYAGEWQATRLPPQ